MEYQNGKIYKVVCEKTKRIYIGSTCSSLVRRLYGHKSKHNRCYTKNFINPTIFLIEEYPCDTKEKLLTRELYWMQNTECVNTLRPILSKEEILKQNKKYSDYSNGKIYKIECGETGRIYIGSTIQTLNKRLNQHKTDTKRLGKCVTKDFINPSISLIEDYPCDTNTQLLTRERYYMENTDCINTVRPIISKEERKEFAIQRSRIYSNSEQRSNVRRIFYENNKEEILKKKKKYREDNKEKISERGKKKITCECGSTVRKQHLIRHKKSKKHIKLTT